MVTLSLAAQKNITQMKQIFYKSEYLRYHYIDNF